MVDPLKIVSDAEKAANAAVQDAGPKAVSFLSRPVPLWAVGVAFLVGALVGKVA